MLLLLKVKHHQRAVEAGGSDWGLDFKFKNVLSMQQHQKISSKNISTLFSYATPTPSWPQILNAVVHQVVEVHWGVVPS